MTDPYDNANEIFEGIGDLYYRRYHRLRPGKDDPMRNSMSEENIRQFRDWLKYEALDDAVARINELEAKLEEIEART